MDEKVTGPKANERSFLGHPMGLWVLFTTEMWERFCYYGMRAFLVLYLYQSINGANPGLGWSEEEAYNLYGWFTSLVYLLPLVGGYIADRFIGQHKSVLWGGILIAMGEFALFLTEYFRMGATQPITLSSAPSAWLCFMSGLFLIIIGTGFFKPCISIMVGQLYPQHDGRRDVAFTIFYMGINLGALIAPFVAGTVAEIYGWHWGFLTAAIGMIFGLFTYSILRPKYLGKVGTLGYIVTGSDADLLRIKESKEKEIVNTNTADVEKLDYIAGTEKVEEAKRTEEIADSKETSNSQEVAVSQETSAVESRKSDRKSSSASLTRREIDRVVVILALSVFCIAFWAVFEQAGSSLTTFAKRETNRQVPALAADILPKMIIENENENDAANAFRNAEREFVANAQEGKEFSKTGIAFLDEGIFALKKIELAPLNANKNSESTAMSTLPPASKPLFEAKEFIDSWQLKKSEIESSCSGNVQKRNERYESWKKGLAGEVKIEKTPEDTIYTFPATWYQSVNPIGIVLFAPLFALLWGFLARRKLDPSTPVKFGIGLVVLALAFLFMVGGAIQSKHTGGNAGAYWLLFTYIFCTWGELCLSPVGLSMVSKLAPQKYASLLMGVWLFSSAIANYVAAKLASVFSTSSGRIYFFFGENGGLADFFLLLTIIPFFVAVIVFVFASKLRKMMHEEA